ncbi:MAG: histidine kinase [Bacteroidales bacterium]|nr:histidine kinase [Bacteroidales bacterium]
MVFISFVTVSSQSEEKYSFERYSSENIRYEKGMSQNWIYCMMQDRYGYIWFGTWEGLNRFDGYNFRIFRIEEGLSDNTIYTIFEDKDGKIWIGTDNGLNGFDRSDFRFTPYFNIPGDTNSLVNNRVNSIIQTRDGDLWIGTAGGLNSLDKSNGKFKSFFQTPQAYRSPRSNFILHLHEDHNGHIWISTTYGLVIFNPADGRSTRYYHIPDDFNSLSDNNIRCVVQDSANNFWIATANGLNFFNVESQTNTRYYHDPKNDGSLSDSWIRTLFVDRQGNIRIGTNQGGLNTFNPVKGSFSRFTNDVNENQSLSNNRIYSIIEDNVGNLWVGTFKGANKLNKHASCFRHIRKTSNDDKSLTSNIVWGFAEDKEGKLWIATSGGINIFDPVSQRYSYLVNDPDDINSITDNDVRSVLYSPGKEYFYFGTYGSGLNGYDPKKGKITRYKSDPNRNSIAGNYVNQMICDDLGYVWIATGSGLSRFDEERGVFRNFFNLPEDTGSLSNNIVICLLEDEMKNLWIGTDQGLNYLDKASERFTRYMNDPSDPNSLCHNTVFALYTDTSGNIWIGTSGGGLSKYSPAEKKFTNYSTREGLPNNTIYGILEDGGHNLWISTNDGLSKLQTTDGQFINYDIKDGLQSNEFNLGASYRKNDGVLLFGGMNGYNEFQPTQIQTNTHKPTVVISAFRKFNELQPGEIADSDTLNLNHDDNFFSFEISALDFTNPSKHRYRYKLENFDADWIYTDAANRLAEYKKVSPGQYVFAANGTNNDGVWGGQDIEVYIRIKPPWWGTWAFRIVFISLVIILFWLLISNRLKKIRRKNDNERKMLEIEKQMFDLEQKALRLQMNPHFIFNSLNSIQSYILSHDSKTAINYLGKFSQLMRMILANSSSKYITLKEELDAIRHYLDLEKLRFDDKFDYSIETGPDIDDDFIEMPPMILQPYVENSVIHGLVHKKDKGKIRIQVSATEDNLYFCIEDDGIGREMAGKIEKEKGLRKKSRGMLITKARLEILNRQGDDDFTVKVTDLKDSGGNATGTRVELKLPYREI